ncbi:MAG: S8 family peptidase [Gammaproteobacteria bacterium]
MVMRPLSFAVLMVLAGLAQADDVRRSYIVQLADKPVATYTGQISGLPATKPADGQRLNVDAAAVQNYISYLETKKRAVIGAVSAAQVTHRYNVVFNGFAALLTDDEVRALKKHSGVINITADSIMQPHTSYTPHFLGLDQAGGLWQQLGGQGSAGENIIVGIVDSGIWPEHPSFADRVDANGAPSHSGTSVVYGAPPASWKGICQTGEGFTAANCNNKLIGARYFKPATQKLHWTDFVSPRDSGAGPEGEGGHGTHTASTAAGNANVKVVTNGLNLGTLSGIAPRARVAAYKVCWTDGTTGRNGCATSNSVAAIEQAVKDGVNVINFSIGPTAGGGSYSEATEVAFLGAASAGVFVAASAGNNGPAAENPAPASHLSPWVTTVGNSTHDRIYVADVVLGNGVRLTGASGNANTPTAPLILARDAGLPGVAPDNPNLLLCFGGADSKDALLDPAKVTGKILVCDRGSNVLVNKSANGKTAGAVGVIIANTPTSNNTIINQAHSISTVHLKAVDAAKLKAYYADNPGQAVASLGNLRAVSDTTARAPAMSTLSSRGPSVANASILKPDLTAPGTDILAAVTADLSHAERDAIAGGGAAPRTDYAFYSGTSMASPHVAGSAALLKQLHPTWSPAAIKSALMTTAYPTQPDGQTAPLPWDSSATYAGTLPWGQGAGHIAPSSAAQPGLVYDAGILDYARFLCGQNADVFDAETCAATGTIQAHNLNLASITAANVLGTLTLTRTVTNVGPATATYNVNASLPGFTVAVQPLSLTIAPGAKATYKVTLTRTSAPLDTWSYGSLVWSNGSTQVRSPLTARASALAAPATVVSEAATGSKVFTIGTGFTGPIGSVKSGLQAARRETRTVGQSSTIGTVYTAACLAGGAEGVNVHEVTVPAGALAARFSLFEEDTAGGAESDLDLLVVNSAGEIVASSGNGGSNEQVHLDNPAADTYKVCVIGYEPKGGSAQYTLSSWVLEPNVISGNFRALLPGFAYLGGTGTVSLGWSGLAAGQRYLGALRYLMNGAPQGTTIVEVNTNDPLPRFSTVRAAPAPVR